MTSLITKQQPEHFPQNFYSITKLTLNELATATLGLFQKSYELEFLRYVMNMSTGTPIL